MRNKIYSLLVLFLIVLFSTSAFSASGGYGATALTGGGTGALDAIDGDDVSDGDKAQVSTTSVFYPYNLNASSGAAEASPDVISPDSNAGNKRWILLGAYFATLQLVNGTDINEFSTDGTLAGNSDDAVPTEKAVKTYVDAVQTLPKNYLTGLAMSNDTDSDHDIAIAAGECKDSGNTRDLALSATMTKQIDATWAAGDDAGGMFTGSVANSTWYHVFLIEKDSDDTIDAGFDTDVDCTNIPTGYTEYRRIGSVLTDGSANIVGFKQIGDDFFWDDPPLDLNNEDVDTTQEAHALTVPPDVNVKAYFNINVEAGNSAVYIPPHQSMDDEAASVTAAPLGIIGGGVTTSYDVISIGFAWTDTSQQINIRSSIANQNVYLSTLGWMDRRGRDD